MACVPMYTGPSSWYAVSLKRRSGVIRAWAGYLVPFSRKMRLDISPCFQDPRFPHLAAGSSTQQLKMKATVRTTVVQNGTTMGLMATVLEMFAQSRLRFMKPMPPMPPPMKLATGLRGATQQRKERDESIGNTYSGRNCQRMMKMKVPKKTSFCFFATRESLTDLLRVSKTAVCIRA
jgi:hypothetical protein